MTDLLSGDTMWEKIKDIIVICVIPFAGWMWSMSSDVAEMRKSVEILEKRAQKFESQIEILKGQDVEFKVINARMETRLEQIDAGIGEIKMILKERLK
jgi:hypothetical protein